VELIPRKAAGRTDPPVTVRSELSAAARGEALACRQLEPSRQLWYIVEPGWPAAQVTAVGGSAARERTISESVT
jgi:hypothetical protein